MLSPRAAPAAFSLLRELRRLVRLRIDPEAARRRIRERRANRAASFLETVRTGIYENPRSPYHALLQAAGCELGDLRALVAREGLEDALRTLFRSGVYLRGDELKGRVPVVRGSTRFQLAPEALRNPGQEPALRMHTSGSTGVPTGLAVNLAALAERLPNYRLAYDSDGAGDCALAAWGAPGSASTLVTLVAAVAYGREAARCFTVTDPRGNDLGAAVRRGDAYLRLAARLCGRRLPPQQFAPPDAPEPLLDWIRALRAAGGTLFLKCYPTAAVKLCHAAERAGVDLSGCRFNLRGEPVTAARRAAIEAAGVRVSSLYGTAECGMISYSCRDGSEPDSTHLLDDLHALVRVEDAVDPSLPAGALLMSSIRPDARLVLLNASMGDSAWLDSGACSCSLGALGYQTRLHTIRSFEKLTAAGMTFDDAAITRVLEEVLPARFGGTAVDYQVVEADTVDLTKTVRLLVSPEIAAGDTAAIRDAFLDEIGAASSATRMMSCVWRDQGLVVVERRRPYRTPGGKVLHVHRRGATG